MKGNLMRNALMATDPPPCDDCHYWATCRLGLACEQLAFYVGDVRMGGKRHDRKRIEDWSKIPSRALYIRIFGPDE